VAQMPIPGVEPIGDGRRRACPERVSHHQRGNDKARAAAEDGSRGADGHGKRHGAFAHITELQKDCR
jgi:hypothetical protein